MNTCWNSYGQMSWGSQASYANIVQKHVETYDGFTIKIGDLPGKK
jgi:hypothetical protein